MEQRHCNVFVSHVHENDGRIKPLKDMLSRKGCRLRDYSINSSCPNKAKNQEYIWNRIIRPRIDQAGTLAVLITPDMTSKDSEWVEREVNYAHSQGKRIVGIWDRGHSQTELPHGLDEFADSIASWQGDQIVRAIFDEEQVFSDRDGNSLPTRSLQRHGC